jgi:hypothetical protein
MTSQQLPLFSLAVPLGIGPLIGAERQKGSEPPSCVKHLASD